MRSSLSSDDNARFSRTIEMKYIIFCIMYKSADQDNMFWGWEYFIETVENRPKTDATLVKKKARKKKKRDGLGDI